MWIVTINVQWFTVLLIRIWDPVPFWPRDPGWVKNQDPGSRIWDEQPGSYFRELRNHFFVFHTTLKSLMRIRDGKNSGSGMNITRIRNTDDSLAYNSYYNSPPLACVRLYRCAVRSAPSPCPVRRPTRRTSAARRIRSVLSRQVTWSKSD